MLIDTTTIKRIPVMRSIHIPDTKRVDEDILELLDYIKSIDGVKELDWSKQYVILHDAITLGEAWYPILNT